jgi:hypothetical protein
MSYKTTYFFISFLLLLSGVSYGQVARIDSIRINEKDELLEVFGELPQKQGTVTLNNYSLTVKEWNTKSAFLILPYTGQAESGLINIIIDNDTISDWSIKEWNGKFKYHHVVPGKGPSQYPPLVDATWDLFFRMVQYHDSLPYFSRAFYISKKSSFDWDCTLSRTYQESNWVEYYYGKGMLKWNDTARNSSPGFIAYGNFNSTVDTLFISSPGNYGAICHYELWYVDAPKLLLNSADDILTFGFPNFSLPVQSAGIFLPGTGPDLSWDTIKIVPPIAPPSRVGENAFSSSLKCYPNPFSSYITIEFQSVNQTSQIIYLTDILGRTVDILHSECLGNNKHRVVYSPSQLPEGPYYLTVATSPILTPSKLILYCR